MDTTGTAPTGNSGNINIVLSHNGVSVAATVPQGTDAGHIRTLNSQLTELGAPSSYTFGINGMGQDDNTRLNDGDVITFRPVQGNKG